MICPADAASVVFVFDSRVRLRNQRIENIARFFEVHSRLMDSEGFLMTHLVELADESFLRDPADRASEAKFHLLLTSARLCCACRHRPASDFSGD